MNNVALLAVLMLVVAAGTSPFSGTSASTLAAANTHLAITSDGWRQQHLLASPGEASTASFPARARSFIALPYRWARARGRWRARRWLS